MRIRGLIRCSTSRGGWRGRTRASTTPARCLRTARPRRQRLGGGGGVGSWGGGVTVGFGREGGEEDVDDGAVAVKGVKVLFCLDRDLRVVFDNGLGELAQAGSDLGGVTSRRGGGLGVLL
jgi:hypothetical protein